jgi:molybdopterin synthase catalytic subunit
MAGLFRIVRGPIEVREAIEAVRGPDRGAIATFTGTVRDHHAGRRVVRLEYHAYEAMAQQVLETIGREIEERFATPHVAILHRVGILEIGDASVIVAVAAAHRREALAACAHAIDRVKAEAPIWKRECYEDGAAWLEGPDPCGREA